MSKITSCGCCSLLQGCIVTGVYTVVVYLAAFIMELTLILKGEDWVNSGRYRGSLPLPEYILVVLHFSVVGLAVIMLYALYQRRTGVLIAWVCIGSVLLFPEVGIILFLVMFYWDLTNVIGMVELIFYSVRAPVNIICIICVHSLYSMWKNQQETQKSLKKLSSLQMMKNNPCKVPSYSNGGFLGSVSDLSQKNGDLYNSYKNNADVHDPYNNKYGTIPLDRSHLGGSITNIDMQKGIPFSNRGYSSTASPYSDYRIYYNPSSQLALNAYSGYRNWDPYHFQMPSKDARSEFNASGFPPHANLGSMPVLNHAKVDNNSLQSPITDAFLNHLSRGSNNYPDYSGRGMDYLLDSDYKLAYGPGAFVHPQYTTQSLDRRRYLRRTQNLTIDPFAQETFRTNPYYGYPRHKDSKTSLGAESDDFRRYRDVAL